MDSAIRIPFTRHALANGLDVILHEDHRCPIVAVNLWYHVGSKNERPGATGFAHLFEHLMFEGSAHREGSFFQPIEGAGGTLNGSTNADRTNYWEVMPSGALELALWMESDRMGFLLPAITEGRLTTQRDVVLNERRQSYENKPPAHPYHWPTIGQPADLRGVRLDDMQAFFRRYYHPANASLVIAGDIEPGRALDLARRYFEEIPAGEPVAQVAVDAPPPRAVRLRLEDRIELPRLYVAWHSAALFASGDAELDLVGDLLANGKTSRLYRRLVFESRLATDVSAAQNSRELSGYFQIAVTATPNQPLGPLETVVLEEVARFAQDGPSDPEIARGRVQAESQFVQRVQTVGGFGGKSDQLNAYNVFMGDPGYFARDVERYQAATAAGLRDAARAKLRPGDQVTLSVVPRGRPDLAAPDSSPTEVE
jgi:zinc protease